MNPLQKSLIALLPLRKECTPEGSGVSRAKVDTHNALLTQITEILSKVELDESNVWEVVKMYSRYDMGKEEKEYKLAESITKNATVKEIK